MQTSGIQSVDRALRLLWQIRAEPGITLTNLSSRVGLTPSTALRLVATLEQYRLVERGPGKGYHLGEGAFELGAPNGEDDATLVRRLEPIVQSVASVVAEQVSLGVLRGRAVVHVLAVDGAARAGEDVVLTSMTGRRDLNLQATAMGKVILTCAPPHLADQLISGLVLEKTAE